MSYISASVLFSYDHHPTQTASGSNRLITGSIYFNTLSSSAYIWNGQEFVSGFGGTGSTAITNPSQSRLLISDGTSGGIIATPNLTFAGNLLLVSGSQRISGSLFVSESGYFSSLFMTNSYVQQNLYVTGSTAFGSTSLSSHEFTGSVSMSGSLSVFGSLTLPTTATLPTLANTGSIVVFADEAYLFL
jgi:hypothetical protein